jgi:hypothetical protein
MALKYSLAKVTLENLSHALPRLAQCQRNGTKRLRLEQA